MECDRFWSKVDKSGANGCWLWTSTKNAQGYGRFSFTVSKTPPRQKWHSAHRLTWEWANGPIPDGLNVCHRCDNPACVRPDHLFLGTDLDNARDRDAKGRRRPPKGEANARSRLTAADVVTIRKCAYLDRGELARNFGVSRTTVNRIIAKRVWRHVT